MARSTITSLEYPKPGRRTGQRRGHGVDQIVVHGLTDDDHVVQVPSSKIQWSTLAGVPGVPLAVEPPVVIGTDPDKVGPEDTVATCFTVADASSGGPHDRSCSARTIT